jgi:hypothetical protein
VHLRIGKPPGKVYHMEVDTGSTISWLHGVNIWDQGQKSGKYVKSRTTPLRIVIFCLRSTTLTLQRKHIKNLVQVWQYIENLKTVVNLDLT